MLMIDISWGNGRMFVNAEALIREMPMKQFKSWVPLFIRYGKSSDHTAFVHLLDQMAGNTDEPVKVRRKAHRMMKYFFGKVLS